MALPLLAELKAQRDALTLPIKGFHLILRGDTADALREAAADELARLQRRVGIIDETTKVLERLEADGWPALPTREVGPGELADVDDDVAAINAARGFLTAELAANLGLKAGTVNPK